MLVAAVGGGWRLLAQQHDYSMPDEEIALAVVQHVIANRTLDTNWAHTAVSETFRYDQFNFSSYYLTASLLSLGSEVDGDSSPQGLFALRQHLRQLNVLFSVLGVLAAGWLAARLGGTVAGLTAAALTAVNLTLFQDSLYARPETFTTALTLGLALCVTRDDAARLRWVTIAGLLAGLLVASKISFALLLPFVLAALLSNLRGRPAHVVALLFFGACGAGFALGAPYAVRTPDAYLNGVAYLFGQYGGMHWPHGLHDGTTIERLGHAASYLLHSAGVLVLLAALPGLFVLRGTRTAWRLLLAGILLSGLYFMRSPVFFERNLSHVLPFVFVLAGITLGSLTTWLREPRLRLASVTFAFAALVVSPAQRSWTLSRVVLPQAHAAGADAFRQQLLDKGYIVIDVHADLSQAETIAAQTCGALAFRLLDYRDRYTAQRLQDLERHPQLELLAHFPSPFDPAPASTLHTYHAAGIAYLARKASANAECTVAVSTLPREATQHASTSLSLSGEAASHAHHPGAVAPAWATQLYATWNGADHHAGTIRLEAPLCAGDVIPVVSGPQAQSAMLGIEIDRGDGFEPIYFAALPAYSAGWFGLRVQHGSERCLPSRISLTDPGEGWGAWAGIGTPASPLPALPDGTPSHPDSP